MLRAEPGPQTCLGFGAAGAGLFLLRLWEAVRDDGYLAGAVRYGEWLDRVAVRDALGCHWPRFVGDAPRPPGRWHWTGFENGAAGIGHVLLELHRATGAARWAGLAREVAATLTGQALRDGGEVSCPATFAAVPGPDPEPDRWRWQWCSGAPGIGLFYARAAEGLSEAALLELATGAGESTWARGDVRRNPGQCHGLAGSADLFLELSRLIGEPVWRERAHDFARQALAYRCGGAKCRRPSGVPARHHAGSMLDYLLLLVAFVRAAVGGRAEVAVENVLLRQQLAVLTRPSWKRPWLRRCHQVVWVLAGGSGGRGASTWLSSDKRRSSAGTGRAGGASGAGSPACGSGGRGCVGRSAG